MKPIKICSVEGNSQKLDGGSMFGNAPRAVWERWAPPDELGRIPLACRALLIEIDGTKILCETGIGSFFEPKLAARFGIENPDRHVLLENLESLNVNHSDIDWVILSHLHFDHAGGLLPNYAEIEKGNEDLLFPKAQFAVGQQAWQRAKQPHFRDRASFIPGLCEKLESSSRLVIVDEKFLTQLFPKHIEFIISDGHTPGQMLTRIKGEHRDIVFCGDLIPGQHWVHLPITMGYDRFPERLIEEKQELLNSLKQNKDLLFFTHDSQVAASEFQKNEKGKFEICKSHQKLEAFEL